MLPTECHLPLSLGGPFPQESMREESFHFASFLAQLSFFRASSIRDSLKRHLEFAVEITLGPQFASYATFSRIELN